MRVRMTLAIGGWGTAGEGMTPELVRRLQASGFKGDPDHGTLTQAAEMEVAPEDIVALAASWAAREGKGK